MSKLSLSAVVVAAVVMAGCSIVGGGHQQESNLDDVPGALKEMAGKSGATEFGQVLVRGSMINLVVRDGKGWSSGGARHGSDYSKFNDEANPPAYTPVGIDKFPLQELSDKMSATICEEGEQKMGQVDSTGTGAFIVSVGCSGPNLSRFTRSYLDGKELSQAKSWVDESTMTKVFAEAKAALGSEFGELKFRAAKTSLAASSMNVAMLGATAKQPDARTCSPTMLRYATPDEANGGKVPMARYQSCESGQEVRTFTLDRAKPAAVVTAMQAAAKKVGVPPDEVEYYTLARSLSREGVELRAFHRGKQVVVRLG